MKKLALLAFMIMFSLTVFSSNNEPIKDEPIDEKILLKSADGNEKNFTLTEEETSLKNLNEHKTHLSETSAAKNKSEGVIKGTTEGEDKVDERQCGGSYTIGILKVNYIKYRSFMRIWIT